MPEMADQLWLMKRIREEEECRKTTSERVVTVDTAEHFIIPIETLFV